MRQFISALSVSMVFATVAAALAQEKPAFPGPDKEHEFLTKFVGEWVTEAEGSPGPGQPPMKCKGTMSARMLGKFWMVAESKMDAFGAPMQAVQTIGYDPRKKKYIGTWVDSMMNHMWRYEGTVDAAGTTLTVEAEGPNFVAQGKATKFRDAYEFKSPDHIVATSSMLGEDGKWTTFMSGHMRRKK